MKKAVKISIICVAAIAALIALAIVIFFIMIEPRFEMLFDEKLDLDKLTSYSRTVTILDCDGKPIDDAAIYDGNKIYVGIDDLSAHTVNAFIAIEDKRFYSHHGVDFKRVASALLSNIKSRSFSEGASTITQQLIKNTHLSNEKTVKRKIAEMRLARGLERVYSKEQILESYFNILYFGSGIRGLGTASRVMFGKSACDLTVAQSAALASIINNPAKYSPYNNPDNLSKRTKLVLKQMHDQGYITDDEYETAKAEQISVNQYRQNQFITGAIREACARLGCSEKALFANNKTVKTSFSPVIAQAARDAIKTVDGDFVARIVVLDNASGGIVCDETNRTKYLNPQRSPASAIKPFIAYATALEKGANPLSQINDVPTTFGEYSPSNYKNTYRGYCSLKDCLIYSSNVAAVKLLQQSGVENGKSVAHAFGLNFEQSDDSLALALGGMEKGVTLPELANAYRTLANGGVYSPCGYIDDPRAVKTICRAVGEDTAYLITDMLTECAKSGTAKGLRSHAVIAAKTGTNGDENGNYDCYCIAYTPKHTVAVWLGADGAAIDNNITGASCCKLIDKVCKSGKISTDEPFVMPDSVAYFEVDGQELNTTHEVYLADPFLPKRYRYKTLLSKRFLPIKKGIDFVDYYDYYIFAES